MRWRRCSCRQLPPSIAEAGRVGYHRDCAVDRDAGPARAPVPRRPPTGDSACGRPGHERRAGLHDEASSSWRRPRSGAQGTCRRIVAAAQTGSSTNAVSGGEWKTPTQPPWRHRGFASTCRCASPRIGSSSAGRRSGRRSGQRAASRGARELAERCAARAASRRRPRRSRGSSAPRWRVRERRNFLSESAECRWVPPRNRGRRRIKELGIAHVGELEPE